MKSAMIWSLNIKKQKISPQRGHGHPYWFLFIYYVLYSYSYTYIHLFDKNIWYMISDTPSELPYYYVCIMSCTVLYVYLMQKSSPIYLYCCMSHYIWIWWRHTLFSFIPFNLHSHIFCVSQKIRPLNFLIRGMLHKKFRSLIIFYFYWHTILIPLQIWEMISHAT